MREAAVFAESLPFVTPEFVPRVFDASRCDLHLPSAIRFLPHLFLPRPRQRHALNFLRFNHPLYFHGVLEKRDAIQQYTLLPGAYLRSYRWRRRFVTYVP